jgi:hypothetical protein
MNRTLTLATAALITACQPVAAQQMQCAPTEQVYENLQERFGEERVFGGFVHDMSGIVELWGNPESESWTMFVTRPDGISCQITHGSGYSTEKQGKEPNL